MDLHVEKIGEQIAMEFPSYTTTKSSASNPLLEALAIKDLIDARYNKENNILMLVVTEDVLENLKPDFNALLRLNENINGVLVTSESSSKYDYKSRYFWPWSGGNEDPVTGATQTFMAPYWYHKLHKKNLITFQSSKRTGFMEVNVRDQNIIIKGTAVIVIKGTAVIVIKGTAVIVIKGTLTI